MAQEIATSNPMVFGISDVLEAQLRSNRTAVTQSDSPMTKVDRSTYGGFLINFLKEHLINIGFKDLLIMLVLVFIQHLIQLMHLKICIYIISKEYKMLEIILMQLIYHLVYTMWCQDLRII